MERRSGQASECSARSAYLLDGRRVPSPVVRKTEPTARRTGRSERPAIAERPAIDATRLAAKAAADNVAVILDITPGVPHVFQAFAALLDEGDAALNRAVRFVQDNTAHKAAA